MQKEIFAQKIAELVKERHGLDTEVIRINVGNGVSSTALVFDNGLNVRPNIYLDEFYKRYEDGLMCLPEIADVTAGFIRSRNCDCDKTDTEEIEALANDWEVVKEGVTVIARGVKLNEEMLAAVPHKICGDVAAVYTVAINVKAGWLKFFVTNRLLSSWGVSLEELDRVAWENTRRKKPYEVRNIIDVLKNMKNIDLPMEMVEMAANPMGMHILSSKDGTNGAVYLMDNTTLYSVQEDLGWDGILILPSSINECILLPMSGDTSNDLSKLYAMVSEVNQESVPPENVLSYSVYKYVDGVLSIYDGEEWTKAA